MPTATHYDVFLSAVSPELGSYRAELARVLRRRGLHVQAERCQMGRMNVVERLVFLATPFAPQAMQLARWDALARQPGRVVPPLGHYLNLLDDVLRAKCRPQRPMLAAS